MNFKLVSPLRRRAISPRPSAQLVESVKAGTRDQVLLGVTGSGKTFTVAKVIEDVNRPTLVLSHNKTLAAQLYQEFKNFFPENTVEYFVSYYDYYQPEAYIPQNDLYIEKEMTKNDEIDKLRLAATKALFERRDVIIVSSVSCIYGIGDPDLYYSHAGVLRARRRQADDAVPPPPDGDAVRADAVRPGARHVPRARRRARALAGVRGRRGAHRVLRRRDRQDHPHRSDHRPHLGARVRPAGGLSRARTTSRRASG